MGPIRDSISRVRLARARRLALGAAVAALGLGTLAGPASADFTLNSGTVVLAAGSGTGSPPDNSWVKLPTDNPAATPPYFNNPSSSLGEYTYISRANDPLGPRLGTPSVGLSLNGVQGAYGITGDLTETFNFVPWHLYTRATTATYDSVNRVWVESALPRGWEPELTFSGNATDRGTRNLVSGDLRGLWVSYGGGDYYVGTSEDATHGLHVSPLSGTITGSTATPGVARITLNWNTNLEANVAPGFEPFRAQFQLVGQYS